MAIHIKDHETDRLARELAVATGESITDAIRLAVEERLARVRRRPSSAASLTPIIARGRSRIILDERTEAEILGYGLEGLPV